MTIPTRNQTPYLITSRKFPVNNPQQLDAELSKFCTDVSDAVNDRINGIFETFQIVTGENWYNLNFQPPYKNQQKRRQSYRYLFTFGAIEPGTPLAITHGITGITQITHHTGGGVVTDIPDFRIVPYVSATLATDQIELQVTPTQIIIINGSTAPAIVSGYVDLEYLLN